jgi:hypothetical protein
MGKRVVLVATLGILAAATPAFSSEVFITNFTKSNNMQAALQLAYPSGLFTPAGGFGNSFDITADGSNHNFDEIGGGTTLTIPVSLFGVNIVYTMINAYAPPAGANIASVEFIGDSGGDETFQLINGTDVRDFYQGSFANSINGTTSKEVFRIDNVVGGAATGNSSDGLLGSYVLDAQQFALASEFLNQNLVQIKITSTGAGGTPLLMAVTVETAAPEPGSFVLSALGPAAALMLRRRNRVALASLRIQ